MKKITLIVLTIVLTSSSMIGQTTFNKTQTLTLATGGNVPPEGDAPYPIASADVDDDGFIDLVVGTDLGGAIFWYKNDGLGNFTVQPTVTTALPRVSDIVLADINGDTSIDIIATSFSDNKVVYYPNSLAIPGTFGTEQVVASSLLGAGDVDIVDLNGDTFPDLVVSAYNDDKVVWYANNGTGGFGAENLITTFTKPGSIDMLNIDANAGLDIVIANATTPGELTSVIEVYYNASLVFTKDSNSVTTGKDYMFNVSFEDIDASNNATGFSSDILATDLYGNLVHYNKDMSGTYSETIISTTIANPASVGFYDLDEDGLDDILLSSGTNGSGNDLVWYKNNGAGSFSAEAVIDATQNNVFKFTVNDFDNDGDMDIASAAYSDDQVSIFNNQKIVLGLDDKVLNNLNFYPNPVSNQLHIKSSSLQNIEYKVYDLLGKKLIEGKTNSNTYIDLSNLKPGAYLLKVQNAFEVYKFIKN